MNVDIVGFSHVTHVELLGHLSILEHRLVLRNRWLKDLSTVDQRGFGGQATLRLCLVELCLLLLLIAIF